MQMASTIHDVTIVNTGRNDSKTFMEIKKPHTVAQYNKFYEGHRLGRPVTQLLHSSEENFNPSAWSDDHCSSCCMLSLIRLYLDNIGSKCNRAALCLFVKELALL